MPDEHDRAARHAALRELLAGGEVYRQEQLVAALARRGIATTQSVVSRDLRELGAGKVAGRYRLLDVAGGREEGLAEILGDFVLGVAAAGPHLLVVRTRVGGAQPVAVAIDRAGWPGLVGSVAGDDTVFLATTDRRGQREVAGHLAEVGRVDFEEGS